jgi:hypothetical protein
MVTHDRIGLNWAGSLAMATPTSRPFELRGADGSPLRGDVRSGGGARPALVVWPTLQAATERLARAGFTVVSVALPAAFHDVDIVLDALRAGELGPVPTRVAVLGHGAGGREAAGRAAGAGRADATVVWTPAPPGGNPAQVASTGTGLTLTVPAPWQAGRPEFEHALAETVKWLADRLA